MRGWRDRGFVQDSDEEEELDSIDTQSPPQPPSALDTVDACSDGIAVAELPPAGLSEVADQKEDDSEHNAFIEVREEGIGGGGVQDILEGEIQQPGLQGDISTSEGKTVLEDPPALSDNDDLSESRQEPPQDSPGQIPRSAPPERIMPIIESCGASHQEIFQRDRPASKVTAKAGDYIEEYTPNGAGDGSIEGARVADAIEEGIQQPGAQENVSPLEEEKWVEALPAVREPGYLSESQQALRQDEQEVVQNSPERTTSVSESRRSSSQQMSQGDNLGLSAPAQPASHAAVGSLGTVAGDASEEETSGSPWRPAVQVVITKRAASGQNPKNQEGTPNNNRRTFRPRNPIQLHPYLLEGEHYRRTLKARGLKPIRIATPALQQDPDTQAAETQDQEFNAEEESQSASLGLSSPPTQSTSPPPTARPPVSAPSGLLPAARLSDGGDSSDDLPGLDTLLHRGAVGPVQQGHKRRKIGHTFSKKEAASRNGLPSGNTPRTDVVRDVYDVPPSPPTSHSSPAGVPNPADTTAFRIPRGLSPNVGMPTPTTSSITRPHRQLVVSEESEDDTPPLSTIRRRLRSPSAQAVTVGSSQTSQSESEDNEDPSEIKQVQKRIKGVLPASWLRLDQQARKQGPAVQHGREHRAASLEHVAPQRGVARRITATGRTRTTSPEQQQHSETILIMDESNMSSGSPSPQKPRPSMTAKSSTTPRFKRVTSSALEFGDIEEDDTIDFMLPPTSRKRVFGKGPRKRQTNITDSLGHSRKRSRTSLNSYTDLPPMTARSAANRTSGKSTVPLQRPRSRKPRVPNLGVLDARDLSPSHGSAAPHFLRLAARQARRRPDYGRHSPSGKAIRLQTYGDSEEANRPLRDWRAGTLAPCSVPDVSASRMRIRLPLHDISDNKQQQRFPSPVKLPALTDSETTDRVQYWSIPSARRQSPKLQQQRLQPVLLNSVDTRPTALPTKSNLVRSITTRNLPSNRRDQQPLYRAAQLEGLETDFSQHHHRRSFRTSPSRTNHGIFDRLHSESTTTILRLERFLADDDAVAPETIRQHHEDEAVQSGIGQAEAIVGPRAQKQSKRKPRKRPPMRIDAEAREFRQPEDPLPPEDTASVVSSTVVDAEQNTLRGLGPYGTRYPIDFDICPLGVGTFFHDTTFVGSGEFLQSLTLLERDLDMAAGHASINYCGRHVCWSFWTEEVASEMAEFFLLATERIKAMRMPEPDEPDSSIHQHVGAATDINVFLRALTRYFRGSLSFLDPIDRRSFVSRMLVTLQQFQIAIDHKLTTLPAARELQQPLGGHLRRSQLYLLVMTYQLLQIGKHPVVDNATLAEVQDSIRLLARTLTKDLWKNGMNETRAFLEGNRRHAQREAGIRNDGSSVGTIVILMHVMDHAQISAASFWEIWNDEVSSGMACMNRLQQFERIWYDLFTVLPIGEFDANGLLRVGKRFQGSAEHWGLVRALLGRLFTLYPETCSNRSASVNDYLRAILARCHRLIHDWGWRRCESVLGTMFDFFARNNLSPLFNEESRGSPLFLESLREEPALDVQQGDRAFHIFLKTLAVGLKSMRSLYTEKRIGGIVWRFIPNHGRTYRKDEELKRADVDALRNHHDLLCTLYWVSPAGCRPRPDLLRNLVDHNLSHTEACRVNIRAWTDLTRYQISTDEPAAAMDPFATWFRDIVDQTVAQYRWARTEAEGHYEKARIQGNGVISTELLQRTISNNQEQVLAILSHAVIGMRSAISIAQKETAATALLLNSSVTAVFGLFDPKNAKVDQVVVEALGVIRAHAALLNRRQAKDQSQQPSEESQDYGEWPDLEDDATTKQCDEAAKPAVEFIHEPLAHLLSNCFGAEPAPSDRLLTEVIDTWATVAALQVRYNTKTWDDYISAYGQASWHQLRDTEQTRKFTAYFLSAIVESDPTAYQDHCSTFVSSWILSLMERESMLKYQHRLTTVLINNDPTNPLLRNLPFLAGPRTGRYEISAGELRERRLSLVSGILANMREEYEAAMHDRPDELVELRRDYSDILKQVMMATKKHYQELQQGTAVRGAYVEFVQKVVGFLQQYTADICPVDKFFTDSAAFPLPATDPTYVVGRLKGYASKLSDPRMVKQLAVFIQTVSERAAVDDQQAYLVDQMYTAVSGTFESGNLERPSLRYVLVQAVFPAYIEQCFKSATGWILAKPVLQALTQMLSNLQFDTDVTDQSSRSAVVQMITGTLKVLRLTVELLVDHSGLLEQPYILHMLGVVFQTITAPVLLLDYIIRRTRHSGSALQHIKFFRSFGAFTAQMIRGQEDGPAPELEVNSSEESNERSPEKTDEGFDGVRQFCARELDQVITANWAKYGDQYYLIRGNIRKEVRVDLRTVDEERVKVLAAIDDFNMTVGRMSSFGDRAVHQKRELHQWMKGLVF
ncbi:hypothetical protein W97_03795 [Coniosporium apollinis CBS 100218]|uniref:Uncharacterized protein n=1 Tax=Coniosporium apollinis (strain CBS 100218) TaxID=1168221 RepID=R7YRN3_CONA1|nr:uncharacterized protein W97_03795 [Coniosporium apollinis CBS 100218]EON64562.1 hypothetical protein W97_03795 [Coniosporium apollinis CBS 100218]